MTQQITVTVDNVTATAHWDEQSGVEPGWYAEWTRGGEYAADSQKVGAPDLSMREDEIDELTEVLREYAAQLAGVELAHGLTFAEWLERADSYEAIEGDGYDPRAAWLAGEDPEDYQRSGDHVDPRDQLDEVQS